MSLRATVTAEERTGLPKPRHSSRVGMETLVLEDVVRQAREDA